MIAMPLVRSSVFSRLVASHPSTRGIIRSTLRSRGRPKEHPLRSDSRSPVECRRGIGRLARAIRAKDALGAMSVFPPEVVWRDPARAEAAMAWVGNYLSRDAEPRSEEHTSELQSR